MKKKNENVGVGIVITRDDEDEFQLTLGFESQDVESLTYTLGLMAHGSYDANIQQQIEDRLGKIKSKFKHFTTILNESEEYWWYGCMEENILSLTSDQIVSQIMDLYELVKDIK